MIAKIVLTALVIILVYLFGRSRSQRPGPHTDRAPPQRGTLYPTTSRFSPRLAAYGAAAVIALTTGLFYYQHWRDQQRIITIRVINTRTGEIVTYRGHKGLVQGRHFQTLDGRGVTVADIERVEIVD